MTSDSKSRILLKSRKTLTRKEIKKQESYAQKLAQKIKNDVFVVGRCVRQYTNDLIQYSTIKLSSNSKKIYVELYDPEKLKFTIDKENEVSSSILRKYRDTLFDLCLELQIKVNSANGIYPAQKEPQRSIDIGVRRKFQNEAIGVTNSIIAMLNTIITMCPHQLKGFVHYSNLFSGLLKGIREWRNYVPGEKDRNGNKKVYPQSNDMTNDALKALDSNVDASKTTFQSISVDDVDNLSKEEIPVTIESQKVLKTAMTELKEFKKEQEELKKESEMKNTSKVINEKNSEEKEIISLKDSENLFKEKTNSINEETIKKLIEVNKINDLIAQGISISEIRRISREIKKQKEADIE